ncbi:MAG: RraA family protein, partial [Chromatiales bacterium]|nr:RraA family protein [Chromatiales bacterium]
MMRESFYSAVLCDALDSLGYTNQSPRLQLKAMTGIDLLVGRCKTMLWADMAHEDERPYELELQAVDGCKADDVMIVAASGSMRSGIWGELLSGASRNAGCVGVIADGAVRDVRQMTNMQFPVFALGACIYDSRDRQ